MARRAHGPPAGLGRSPPQVFAVLSESGVARDDKLGLLEAINSLEKAAMVWERKASGKKDAAANARLFIKLVRAQVARPRPTRRRATEPHRH